MNIIGCITDGCARDLLQNAQKYGERMKEESPYSRLEMAGRLMTLSGAVCTAANSMYKLEKKSRIACKTLAIHDERLSGGGMGERQAVLLETVG